MRLLSRLRVPVIPVGVFESSGRMVASFGRDCSPSASADGLMEAIALQLPLEMRGQYSSHGALG